jgi:F-type H+-transporting ATPase subunit epsilon
MSKFPLEIVTPIRLIEDDNVSYLRCPGKDGLFGVMANHAQAIIALDIGELKIESDTGQQFLSTSGGFIEISDDKVLLILETVERSSEIDQKRAEAALKRAKERLQSNEPGVNFERARIALLRSLNRLRVLKK